MGAMLAYLVSSASFGSLLRRFLHHVSRLLACLAGSSLQLWLPLSIYSALLGHVDCCPMIHHWVFFVLVVSYFNPIMLATVTPCYPWSYSCLLAVVYLRVILQVCSPCVARKWDASHKLSLGLEPKWEIIDWVRDAIPKPNWVKDYFLKRYQGYHLYHFDDHYL